MVSSRLEPQLSALALLDAYRAGSFDAVRNIMENTTGQELYMGLVQISMGLLCSMAALSGMSPEHMTEVFRQGMLAVPE